MTRRCGALLPSGKRCPTFVSGIRSTCQRCETRIMLAYPLMLPPPQRRSAFAKIAEAFRNR